MIRPRPDVPLGAQFAAVARSQPEAMAVVDGQQRLDYGELDRRSSALAARLAAVTGPQARVGVCLPAGVDAVVAIVAAVRAGRPYVPLDPGYPPPRLRYIADDAELAAVVVGEGTPDMLRRHAGAIALDGPAGYPPPAQPSLSTPVYVIYTSGSTGSPKGVVVTHGNVAALLAASTDLFRFGATDTWTLLHSISFDFSVWELWGALLHGARLVIVDPETRLVPDRLIELIEAERVTVFNVVPSVFRELVAEFVSRPRDLALRYVIFGGEAVHLPSVAAFRAACVPSPALVNMYGITETTVHVTAHVLEPDDERTPGVSPIGRPLPHLQAVVVDDALRPVPTGTVGELCVAGAGVAVGYLGRPQLTAERFVRLEVAGSARRFYRSGDLVRCTARGTLEYVGRADQQVKVRGFRIEPAEIEAGLESLPDVAAAAVRVEHNPMGEPVLVGYVVPRLRARTGDDRRLARSLRAALRAILPDHMVPGRLVPVTALPRTPSGKLDRGRLGTGESHDTGRAEEVCRGR